MPSTDVDARLLGALTTGSSHRALTHEDWERLATRAVAERLAPLVYWKQRNDPSLPRGTSNRLRAELYRTSAVNQILFRELGHFLEAATQRGLRAPIVLKGAALAASLYDDIALRPMGDVDLLVAREDVDGFVAIAHELGFSSPHPEMARGLHERVRYHVALERSRDSTAKLEIHWGLIAGDADRRAPDVTWFRERAEPWIPPPGVDRTPASALAPTALLLYLAAHAMVQHGAAGTPLIWLHDIHLVATRHVDRIDWQELREQAEKLGWRSALQTALRHAKELFDTSLPEAALPSLDEAGAPPHIGVAEPDASSSSRAEWVWRELGFVRFPERARWVLAILFPRPAYVKWRYPSAGRFWPTCYVYRWGVVALEGARAVARRARGYRRRIVDKRG